MAEPKEIKKKGMGKDKGSRKFENTSAADRKKANADGKFGYFDEANKRYVPAFIDAIDGGGRDTRGDEFAGGPLSQILNNIGISPYGSQRERAFGGPTTSPIQQAVAGSGISQGEAISRPRIRPQSDYPDMRMPANAAYMSPLEPFGGPGPDVSTLASQATMERSMGLDPFGGAGMDMGEAGRGSMPAAQYGATTQEMALANLQNRINAVKQAGGSEDDLAPLYAERLVLLEQDQYGSPGDNLGPAYQPSLDYLMPPEQQAMQYSGRGLSSGMQYSGRGLSSGMQTSNSAEFLPPQLVDKYGAETVRLMAPETIDQLLRLDRDAQTRFGGPMYRGFRP